MGSSKRSRWKDEEEATGFNPEAERLLGDDTLLMAPNYYSNLGSLPGGHSYTRLLHLGPAAVDDRDAPLQARLEPINLQSPHFRFEALSYVWGHDIQKDGIQLLCQAPNHGGYIFAQADITVNLTVALKHLRHCDRTRILWVDAICINQDDVAEKTHQVGLMSKIYRQADRVLIWMGPAQHRSDWVLGHVNKLFQQFQAAHNDEQPTGSIPSEQASDPTPPPTILSDDETFAFAQLLNREWYTRVWVIQELCVAKEAVVICGDSSAPWDALFRAFGSVEGSVAYGQPSSALNYGMTRHKALSWLRALTMAGNLLGLDEALVRCQWSRASSPVDKVYALLGIARDQGIIPDYSVSTETCFTLAATVILSRSKVSDLLDFVLLPASTMRNKHLPSWVPDWSPENVAVKTEVAQSLADTLRLEQILNSNDTRDAPTGVFQARFRGTSTLILRGVEIDTVTAMNQPIPGPWLGNAYAIEDMDEPPEPEGNSSFREQASYIKAQWNYVAYYLKYLVTVAGKTVDYASTMAHIHELFVFTRRNLKPHYLANTTRNGHVPTKEPITRLADLLLCNTKALCRLSDLDATRVLLAPLDMASRLIPRLYRALFLHKLLPSFIYHAVIALTGICGVFVREDHTYTTAIGSVNYLTPYIGMRMGLSGDRKFLCLVPHTCYVGDKIVLVAGGRHPYILRRIMESDVGDRWVLVGPCYVSSEEMDELRKLWVEGDARDMLID